MLNRPVRVAVVIPRYYPVFGGAENQCRALSGYLIKTTRTRIVWTLTKRIVSAYPKMEMIDGVEVHRLGFGGVNRWSEYWFYLCVMARLVLRRSEYDVVHCHASALLGFTVMLAGTLLQKPVVLKLSSSGELLNISQHRGAPTGLVRKCITTGKLQLAKLTARNVHFVALTEEGFDELDCVSAKHPLLIPNGVDTSIYCPASPERRRALRKDLGIDEDAHVLTFTGRLVSGKGIDVLLDALCLLSKSMPNLLRNVHICLVGSDYLQDNSVTPLLQKVEAYLSEVVCRYEPRNPPVDFLHASDVFLFPSRQEGMPNSVLEAFSVGLPCILSDIRPHKELAKHNPAAQVAFFTSGDSAALAQVMGEVLRARVTPTFHSVLAPEFDLRCVAAIYAALYSRLHNEGIYMPGDGAYD